MVGSCDEDDLRRGPWTLDEDNILIHYVTSHGEGRWNVLAKSSGLKRTGKSCRLRWLNYLKPDIKRGNLTPQEQLLILELHSKWGNRWSKIANHLPGRTDNEIKNYWRTRVQKQARHLKIDSNSKRFVETLRRFWMPRLLEKVEQSISTSAVETEQNNSIPFQQAEKTLTPSSSPKPAKIKNPNSSSMIRSPDSVAMLLPENLNLQTDGNGDIDPSVLQNDDCYHLDITTFDMALFHLEMQGDMSAPEFQLAGGDWMDGTLNG